MFGLGKKKAAPAVKVSLVGMNERALQLFTMFLDGPVRGECEVVTDGSQDVVIIDMDGVEGSRLWLDVRRKFQGPVMVLSVSEKQIDLHNAYWVAKPVKEDAFRAALVKVRAALQNPPKLAAPKAEPQRAESVSAPPAKGHVANDVVTQKVPSPSPEDATKSTTSSAAQRMNEEMDQKSQNCCGDFEDAIYLDPRTQSQVYFDPAATLLGVVRQALELTREKGIAKIERTGAHPLYIGSKEDFVSTPMPEAYLRAVCARDISTSPLQVVVVEVDGKTIGPSEDPRLRRLDNLRWKTALWSARGRVPKGTSLTAPVKLLHWPNIPRWMTVPHGMRIAALWAKQPTGLLETAQKLGVPCRYVFGFYTACQSFGLVEQLAQEGGGAQSVEPREQVNKEKRGLFGSLLRKLGFG